MDPELFNQFGSMVGTSTGSGSGYDTVPTANDLNPGVDSSGNSLMALSMGLQVGGTLLSAYGDIVAGNESQQADDYNANLALMQGQFDVSQLGLEETGTLSTQKAMYAKAGVTMSGSPLDTAINTASQFEMDKQIETYNAQSKANMDIYAGKVAQQQGEFKASESLLSGASSLAMEAGMLALLA